MARFGSRRVLLGLGHLNLGQGNVFGGVAAIVELVSALVAWVGGEQPLSTGLVSRFALPSSGPRE